jgi:FG-GAP-like repeat
VRLLGAGAISVVLAAGSLTVTRAQHGCEFRVTPVRVELGTGAASGAVTVEAQHGCTWTVDTVGGPWIRAGVSGGTGSGIIPYSTDAVPPLVNTPRQGRLRVRWNTPTAGQDVLVTQSTGTSCGEFAIPGVGELFDGVLSSQTFGGKGASGVISVLAEPVYSGTWRFVGAPDWFTFVRPPLFVVGTGDGGAFFVVAPNPSPLPRDGVLTLCSGQTLPVHQAGRSPRNDAVATDFDDDGRSDPAVFRPSTGTWWILGSQSGYTESFIAQMGTAGMFPMPGDYDGDNRLDLVVYNPVGHFGGALAGNWSVRYSSNGYDTSTQTLRAFPHSYEGYTPQDVPLLADFNGDGRPDFVTFRGATGEWAVYPTDWRFPWRLREEFPAGEYNGHWQWGQPGDVPVPGDFDGDRFAELAVWRPSNGLWFLRMSSNGYQTSLAQVYQWGLPGDRPIVGDFDADGRTDLCVWRPSNGVWYIVFASTSYNHAGRREVQWGLPGDVPVAGDYDGDGRTDLAVWRPSTGFWYILFSSTGYSYAFASSFQWGLPGDVPLSGRITSSQ